MDLRLEFERMGASMLNLLALRRRGWRAACAVSFALAISGASVRDAEAQQSQVVFINNSQLPASQIRWLEQSYGVRLQSGRYWYDPRSGLWGAEGSPTAGKIQPRLSLGGPLRSNAATGLPTGVFFNGRALHPLEIAYIARCVAVVPGRYWLDASGLVGFEGGMAIGNLAAALERCNAPRAMPRPAPTVRVGGRYIHCAGGECAGYR